LGSHPTHRLRCWRRSHHGNSILSFSDQSGGLGLQMSIPQRCPRTSLAIRAMSSASTPRTRVMSTRTKRPRRMDGTWPVATHRRIVCELTLHMVAASCTVTRSGGDAARSASTLAASSVKARSMAAIRAGRVCHGIWYVSQCRAQDTPNRPAHRKPTSATRRTCKKKRSRPCSYKPSCCVRTARWRRLFTAPSRHVFIKNRLEGCAPQTIRSRCLMSECPAVVSEHSVPSRCRSRYCRSRRRCRS